MHFRSIKEYTDYLFDRKDTNEAIRKAYDLLARSDDNIGRVIQDRSLSPQEYIEVIALRRKEGYSQSTGGGSISAEHQTNLMYMNSPWKFIEEFLQNADDCKYQEKPTIEISVNEKLGIVEFIYNEEGFSREDVWALTAFEQSTKNDESDGLLETEEEGVFYKEKTGRKGIGFKSVFSLKASNIRIHIRSNEYSFILDKAVGSVMPIWEDVYADDGKTHVIVELIKPAYTLKTIAFLKEKMLELSAICSDELNKLSDCKTNSELLSIKNKLETLLSSGLPEEYISNINMTLKSIHQSEDFINEIPNSIEELTELSHDFNDKQFGKCALYVKTSIEEKLNNLQRKQDMWISRYIDVIEGNIEKMTVVDCSNWLDRTRDIPTYLDSGTVLRYSNLVEAVNQRLHKSRIEGVFVMYSKLSEAEQQEFRKLIGI